MTTGNASSASTARTPRGSTAGYVAAIVANAVLLIAVNSSVLWDLLPFVTADIDRVLPVISLSLAAAIAVNAAYVAYDARWFTALTQIGVLAINLLATARLLQVFPFDFTRYGAPWETVTRVVLVLALAGVAIALVVEAVRFVVALTRL